MFFTKMWLKSVIIFSLFFSPVRSFSQTEEAVGYLKIETKLRGIDIEINDTFIGKTPLKVIPLSPGEYTVTALHPRRYVWGNLDWQQHITITASDTVTVAPVFKTILSIRTHPYGAEVFLNGKSVGKTPLTILRPTDPSAEIVLKKQGFRDYTIHLQDVRTNFLDINLSSIDEIFELYKYNNWHKKQAKRRYRNLSYGLWGLSLLSGLSAVYFKNQADINYNKYLTAGSLHKMNSYYHETEKYDRYTNISLGVLQGCFVLSFYFLMKSFE